jgi:hypothetical protein
MFFDVPNLMEVAARFAGLYTFESGTSPVPISKLASGSKDGWARRRVRTRRRDRAFRPRARRGLEEESEAQEGQGVAVRQRTTALRTDTTETASKMAASAVRPELRCRKRHGGEESDRPRKNIRGAKAPGDRRAHGGSGEFFEGW